MYRVTRKFIGGLLEGIVYTEITNVKYEVGFVCLNPSLGTSPYIILGVEIA